MRKTAMIAAGLLLGAGLLAGCGGDGDGDDNGGRAADDKTTGSPSGSYCDVLKSAKTNIDAFSGDEVPTTAEYTDFLDNLAALAEKAPTEIAGDWKVVRDAMKTFSDALDDAGLSIEEFGAAAASGKPPEGLSEQESAALMETLTKSVASEEFDKASTAIDENAEDDCGVDLSMGSGSGTESSDGSNE